MELYKLACHFHFKHSNLEGKPFEWLLSDINDQKQQMKKMTTTEKSFFHASYLISLQIAKTKKSFMIEEDIVKPCILSADEEILGSGAA